MTQNLGRWLKDYGSKGLVVISLDDSATGSVDGLKKYAEKNKVSYPMVRDATGDNFRSYGVKVGTVTYLIDIDGRVRWEGLPLRGLADLEKTLKEQLAEVAPERIERWKKQQEE